MRRPGRQERRWSREDRRRQLHAFAEACGRLAAALDSHGDADGVRFHRLAAQASLLAAGDLHDANLSGLASSLPARPLWLNAKAVDSGVPQEPWQRDLEPWFRMAESAALDLRSWGEAS